MYAFRAPRHRPWVTEPGLILRGQADFAPRLASGYNEITKEYKLSPLIILKRARTSITMENIEQRNKMPRYVHGDSIKVAFTPEGTGESEWMWVRVDYCDDQRRIVFGWLDNEPIVQTEKLNVGQHLAISYDNVREHRRAFEPRG